MEWLKTCFNAYAHTSRPPEPCPQKRYFLTSGVVKNVSFYAFLDYQNHVLKKNFISPLEWLKTCFDAFPHHPIQVLKNCFLTSVVVKKRVLMHFQTTRIKSLKKYFFSSGVVKNVFLCISWPPEPSP